MSRLLSFAILLSTALLGCADTPSSQGPSTETSGISARILDSNGTALAGIGVRVVAQEAFWRRLLASGATPQLARGTTDAEGRIRFEITSRDRVMLELDDTLHAARLEAMPGSDTVRELHATRGSQLKIHASAPSETISQLWLAGTGYRGAPQGDGSWLLRGVLRGTYSVAALTDSGITLLGQVRVDAPSLDTTLVAETDSVLLEDFSQPPTRNRYGPMLGGGWWYTVTDADAGGKSATDPARPSDAWSPCADGYCLDMGFSLDATRPIRYALVGMDLDASLQVLDTARHADLSKITSIRFRAAGGGNMLFQLAVRIPSGGYTACHTPLSLSSTLSTIDIPIASLTCDSADADFRHVFGMTWTATSNGRLLLGRVSLIGAGPRSVFRGLSAP
ncbi:MAG: Ig-like domain-containing protein [Fibrobacterota bacterium]|nr:MAG: Ig-like domain-containing protein [Fibrobacterota bacterium]